MVQDSRRAGIPQHVYGRAAGERVVLVNMLNLRTTVLDEVGSQLWRELQSRPGLECPLRELVAVYAPRGGAAAELALERIQQMAQAGLLELKE